MNINSVKGGYSAYNLMNNNGQIRIGNETGENKTQGASDAFKINISTQSLENSRTGQNSPSSTESTQPSSSYDNMKKIFTQRTDAANALQPPQTFDYKLFG